MTDDVSNVYTFGFPFDRRITQEVKLPLFTARNTEEKFHFALNF